MSHNKFTTTNHLSSSFDSSSQLVHGSIDRNRLSLCGSDGSESSFSDGTDSSNHHIGAEEYKLVEGNLNGLLELHDEHFIELKCEAEGDGTDSSNHHIGAEEYKLLVEENLNGLLELHGEHFIELKCEAEGNSVLHIAASVGQAQLIYKLLQKTKDLIKLTNNIGDLAFHSAIKASQVDSLKALLDWSQYDLDEKSGTNLLLRENDEREIPLHTALENNQEEMARMLVEKYGQACYHLNKEGVSPLYLAIKSKYWEIVKLMISFKEQKGESKTETEQPLPPRKSVVHAAIEAYNEEILKKLLDNDDTLIESVDCDNNESPLSYAAFKGFGKGVQYLLEKSPVCAYKCDKAGSFPIHRAASGGNVKVVTKLHMTKNLLNQKGQSILHVAAASGSSEVVSDLIKVQRLYKLLNLKDENGNTPLHLASKGFHPRVVYILTQDGRCKLELLNKKGLTALDYVELAGSFPSFEARLTWLALRYVNAPRGSMSARKIYAKNDEVSDEKELDSFMKRADTLMLVATLIATMTFTAGFTLPGGYNQTDNDPDTGTAILHKWWAFKVFIICNTAALYSSMLCVLVLIWAHLGDLKLILVSFKFALPLLGFAMVMMFVAFMMGIFVVLRNASWLSYVVLVMGCVFLLGVFLLIILLCYNTSYIKNSVLRFLYSGVFLLLLLVCEKITPQVNAS